MKREFRLDEAIKEKESLIEDLQAINRNIQKENLMPTGVERSFDIPKLLTKASLLKKNLILIKLAIQEANCANCETVNGEKYSIQRYIFELSEKKTDRQNLYTLPTRNGSTHTCVITRAKVDEETQALNKRIRLIESKLTDLNHSVTITIENYNTVEN